MSTFNPIFYYNIMTSTLSPYLANLIAYYPYNVDANDFSGKGYDGTVFGTPTFVAGKVANAINFLNTTAANYVSIPDNIDFSFTNNTVDIPFTISSWVNVTQFSATFNRIIQKRGSGQDEYQLYIQPTGQVSFQKFNNGGSTVFQTIQSAVGAVLLNTWVHICITNLNSSTAGLKMYINGVQTATPAVNTGAYTRMINTTSSILIGSPASNFKHRGLLDEMYFWKDRELTAAEVLDIYNKGNSGVPLI